MKFALILLSTLLSNFLIFQSGIDEIVDPATGDIVVVVDNIEEIKGNVFVGLFNSENTFRKIDKVFKYIKLDPISKTHEVVIKDVPFADYAVVVFQDLNENQKFDVNFIGIPKEPFGFSTNFEVTTKAPKYTEVIFDHGDVKTELIIDLQTF